MPKPKMNSWMPRGFCGVAAIILLFITIPSLSMAESDVENEAVKAWSARQRAWRTFRFAWSGTCIVPAGSISLGANTKKTTTGKEQQIPLADTTTEVRFVASIDGRRMQFHHDGTIWDVSKGAFFPQHYDSAYDGKDSVLFWAKDAPNYPRGIIRNEAKNVETNNQEVLPLMLAFRARDEMFGPLAKVRLKAVKEWILLRDKRCRVLEQFGSTRRMISRVWVDPAQDYSIIRYTFGTQAGATSLQIDIEYRNDEQHGYVPIKWEIQQYAIDGRLRESSTLVVDNYSVNVEFPDDVFRIRFPVGTWVTDPSL